MFNEDMTKGILHSIARPELTIYRNDKKHIGYEIRIRVSIRADNEEFLVYLRDALGELNINAKVKWSESKVRPKPILWVSGIVNVVRVCELMGTLPSSKKGWSNFKEAANIIYRGEHTTQNGFDEILRLKGEI